MFPINFNFPYRKKDGSLITMEKALDGAGADLDLIDLDDVAITSPAEGDGLIYDNTAHKWKNIPIISRILALFNAWKKNGAYNLFNPTLTSQSTHGITLVKNGGVYSFSGTSDLESVWTLEFGSYTIPADGDYKIVGCDANGDYGSAYWIGITKNDVSAGYDDGHGKIITCSKGDVIKLNVCFYNLYAITGTVYFKPMITTDLNATYADYVPYAMTNRELSRFNELFSNSSGALSGSLSDDIKTYRYVMVCARTNSIVKSMIIPSEMIMYERFYQLDFCGTDDPGLMTDFLYKNVITIQFNSSTSFNATTAYNNGYFQPVVTDIYGIC